VISVFKAVISWFYKTTSEKNFVLFSNEVQEGSIADKFNRNDAHLELNEDYLK